MNCQCRGVSSRSHGFFKPLLLVLIAALCPSAAFSNELEVVSGPEPPVYFAEGRKEELRKLEEGFEHQTEVKVKTTEDICISMMLLGCMGFMMANFYLINWPDEDIKRISWEVISSTISIFSAVLLFQACNKVLEYYILEDLWIWYQLVIDMMHMSAWFVILQLTLAYFSGALGEHHEVGKHRLSIMSAAATESMSDFRAKLQRENSAKEHFEAVEANVECYAILLGHITGFAAINAWGTLQQAVPRNLVWCGLVPVITLVGILCIYAGTDTLREYKTLADDEEDEWEKLWDEEVAETEDDVMALAVSFLLVQVLRFGISGQLPNSEGEDEEGTQHSTRECGMLLLAAAAFGCFEILKITFRKAIRKALGQSASDGHAGAAHGEKEDPSVWDRLNHVWIRDICAMCTAWSLHFAVDWFLTTNLDVEGAVSAVVCAVVVTCLALGLIFVLDKLADMEFTDDEVDAALRALITSLGILIGFSWERSFDAAVGGLAEQRAFGLAPPVITLLLAIILASMVVPAWKWYILPTTLKYKKEAHHASHNDHEHGSTEHGELHDAEAPSQSADLSEPLLTGKKEVSFREGEPDVIVQSSQGKDEAQKRLEAQAKQLAELQAALAAKEQEVQEARRSSLALKETCEKAERKNIDLAAACEKAHAGARLHADRAVQLEGSLQEKDKALHQRTTEAATLQEDAKRLNAEVTRLQKSTGEQAALTNKLQAVSEHATKLKLLDERREEEMAKAQVRIVDSEAAAQKWEQRATAEAQRSADLEASLRLREKQLETLKVQKASEIDHMSAVATERDRELRQLQADGTGQDVVAKLQAENRQLQQMLDNATAKVKEGLDEQMSLQQQKLQLQEEVRRLEQVSPTKTPRSAAMTPSRPVSIPSTSVAMPLNPSTSSLPGTGSGATIGQASNMAYTPAPFARPAFTWSAQAPPGGALASTVQGTRLISAPQMTSMPAQYVVDRGSYQQPTWPTTVINNPQFLPGSRFT